jgi:hypothetical protein
MIAQSIRCHVADVTPTPKRSGVQRAGWPLRRVDFRWIADSIVDPVEVAA